MSKCEMCGKEGCVLKCSRCRNVKYCCKECQVADWNRHKKDCQKFLPSLVRIVSGDNWIGLEKIKRVKAPKKQHLEGKLAKSEDVKNPILSCVDIDKKFEHYYVETTQENIEELLKEYMTRKGEAQRIFPLCRKALMQYSEIELENHYLADSEEWKTWCYDVNYFFVIRHVLFGTLITIVEHV